VEKLHYGEALCQLSAGIADPQKAKTDAARQLANLPPRAARANSPHSIKNALPSIPSGRLTYNMAEAFFLFRARL
jgi:hypothetical protein